jgi:hypothetical protein
MYNLYRENFVFDTNTKQFIALKKVSVTWEYAGIGLDQQISTSRESKFLYFWNPISVSLVRITLHNVKKIERYFIKLYQPITNSPSSALPQS